MEYEKLFEKALQGRSVNQASKDWGIPQGTLAKYSKGTRVPDYQTALILAREAQVSPGEVMAILARLEARKKPRSLFPDLGYATAALLVSVNLFLTPQNAEAATRLHYSDATQTNTLYYVKLLLKLRLKMLAYFRQAFAPAAA